MTVEDNKVVSLSYELWVDNGEDGKTFYEKATKEQPFVILIGKGNLLPEFESNIKGLKEGESFDFLIDYQNAYGDFDEQNIVFVPRSAFKVDGKIDKKMLKPGARITMRDNKGDMKVGEVLRLEINRIQMDFNHPLAGMDLYFKGEILKIRDAEPEEINHGHVHGPGGHHH